MPLPRKNRFAPVDKGSTPKYTPQQDMSYISRKQSEYSDDKAHAGAQAAIGYRGYGKSDKTGDEKVTAKILGSFKKGGVVSKTGHYQLHKGEHVIPSGMVKHGKNGNMVRKGSAAMSPYDKDN